MANKAQAAEARRAEIESETRKAEIELEQLKLRLGITGKLDDTKRQEQQTRSEGLKVERNRDFGDRISLSGKKPQGELDRPRETDRQKRGCSDRRVDDEAERMRPKAADRVVVEVRASKLSCPPGSGEAKDRVKAMRGEGRPTYVAGSRTGTAGVRVAKVPMLRVESRRSSQVDRDIREPSGVAARREEAVHNIQPEVGRSLKEAETVSGRNGPPVKDVSGTEASGLRESWVPKAVTGTKEESQLVGAFGHQVEAGVASVPLGLWEEGREETPGSARVTCAITNRLGKATDALLTERDFRALVEAREKADSEARKRELAEEQSILSAVAGMFVEASEAVKREPPDDKNRGMVIGPLDQTQERQRTAQCERRAQSEQNKAGDATPIARRYSGSESDSRSERPAANRKLEGEDADEGRPGVRAVKNGVAGTPQGQNCGVGEIIDLGDIGREPATQLAQHADDQRRAIGETSEPLLGLPNTTRDEPLDATKECHSVDDLAGLIGQQANVILATVTRVQRKHSGEETRRSRATAGAASGQSEPPTHVLSPEGGISPVRKTTDNGHNRARENKARKWKKACCDKPNETNQRALRQMFDNKDIVSQVKAAKRFNCQGTYVGKKLKMIIKKRKKRASVYAPKKLPKFERNEDGL
ncbi:microtubule-associated protein 1B-like [Centruroides vittatus]|uniref:microtubule-associated protein 1B-like n=1 Tax=Centruroides vittatus TaxID=120091 RepID=UPI00350F6FBA